MKNSPIVSISRLAVALVVLLGGAAQAATSTYINTGPAGNWSTAGNWSPVGVPADGDDLIFNVHSDGANQWMTVNDMGLPSAASLTFSGTQAFYVDAGGLAVGAGGITNGSTVEQVISNIMLGSDQTWTANAGDLAVWHIDFAGYALNVAGSGNTTLNGTIVGAGMDSRLEKVGSGTLTVSSAASYEGYTLVSAGELVVTGSISNTAATTNVGSTVGGAALTVSGGGVITNESGTIGGLATSSGNTATVHGAGSQWISSGTLNVGYAGDENSLNVEAGGTVQAQALFIGGLDEADANMVVVTDTGSQLTVTDSIVVGYGSDANVLSILAGGSAISHGGTIGLETDNDENQALVSGTGSRWTNTDVLYVGYKGSHNSLTVSAGGVVTVNETNKDISIGDQIGADTNVVTVTGANSSLQNGSTLYVGNGGDDNELKILLGGEVLGKNARISGTADANENTVTVNGTGSSWTNSGTLRVGSNGDGAMLAITGGGNVSFTGNAFVGYGATSSGNIVEIAGTDSALSVGTLTIGLAGTNNVVTVSAGGQLTAPTIDIATNAGSSGTLKIGAGAGAGTVSATSINGGSGTADVQFNHNESNYVFGTTLTGSLSVAVNGGVTRLTGDNTYAGGTTVTAGTLIIGNSAGSATGSGLVQVGAGATLAGGGAIGGDVDLAGRLAPGNSLGTLTVDGDVTWNGTAGNAWNFDLGSGGLSDQLDIGGDFLKGTGTEFVFDLQSGGSAGTYVFATWAGTTTFASGDFSYTNLGSGLTGLFAINGQQLQFTATAVPEPATFAVLLGVGVLGLAGWRRWRRG